MADSTTPIFKSGVLRWIDDRLPIPQPALSRARRLSDAEEPELLVELRLARRHCAGTADLHRHRAGDALHAAHADGVRQRRAHHARRELWLAPALRARQRRLDVLYRGLHPHLPRALFRLLQGAA